MYAWETPSVAANGYYKTLVFRSFFKRSFSDGNILRDSSTPMPASNAKDEKFSNPGLPDRSGEGSKAFCESSPEISTTETESDISFSRFVLY